MDPFSFALGGMLSGALGVLAWQWKNDVFRPDVARRKRASELEDIIDAMPTDEFVEWAKAAPVWSCKREGCTRRLAVQEYNRQRGYCGPHYVGVRIIERGKDDVS